MKSSMTLAGAACLSAVLFANAAHAGGPTTTIALSQSPNPSTVSQPVTLSATVTNTQQPTACLGTVEIEDTTGGGSVAACSFTVSASATPGQSTGSCIYAFPTPGTRSLVANFASSNCSGAGTSGTQVVNAAAATVPTVGEWTMWGLAGMMLLGGAAMLARRNNRHTPTP